MNTSFSPQFSFFAITEVKIELLIKGGYLPDRIFVSQLVCMNNRNLLLVTYMMRCAILYHLYNFKNVKKTHGGVLLLVKLQ